MNQKKKTLSQIGNNRKSLKELKVHSMKFPTKKEENKRQRIFKHPSCLFLLRKSNSKRLLKGRSKEMPEFAVDV
jgi:hypothetical protein